jgi:hypothetical protein
MYVGGDFTSESIVCTVIAACICIVTTTRTLYWLACGKTEIFHPLDYITIYILLLFSGILYAVLIVVQNINGCISCILLGILWMCIPLLTILTGEMNTASRLIDDMNSWAFTIPSIVTVVVFLINGSFETTMLIAMAIVTSSNTVAVAYKVYNKNNEITRVNRRHWRNKETKAGRLTIDVIVLWAVQYDIHASIRPGMRYVAAISVSILFRVISLIILGINTSLAGYVKSVEQAIVGAAAYALTIATIIWSFCKYRKWESNVMVIDNDDTKGLAVSVRFKDKDEDNATIIRKLQERSDDPKIGTGVGDAGLPAMEELAPKMSVEGAIAQVYGHEIASQLKGTMTELAAKVSAGNFNSASIEMYKAVYAAAIMSDNTIILLPNTIKNIFNNAKHNAAAMDRMISLRQERSNQAHDALDTVVGVWSMEELVVQLSFGYFDIMNDELRAIANKIHNIINSYNRCATDVRDGITPKAARSAICNIKKAANKQFLGSLYDLNALKNYCKSIKIIATSASKDVLYRELLSNIQHTASNLSSGEDYMKPEEFIIRTSIATVGMLWAITKSAFNETSAWTNEKAAYSNMIVDTESGLENNTLITLSGAECSLKSWFNAIEIFAEKVEAMQKEKS